jgi:hypothetical protein
LDSWWFSRAPTGISKTQPEDAEERADVGEKMDDSDGVCSEQEHWGTQKVKMVSHPTVVVGEVVPDDVSGDSNGEGQENREGGADGMGNKWLENLAVSLGKHFECGKAQKIEGCKNNESSRDSEEKPFDRMVSERAQVESAEEIAQVRTDAASDESGKGKIAGTKAFEGNYRGRVS